MALVQTSIRRAAAVVGRAIIETVYPKTCAGCGLRGCWLCEICEEETLPLDVPGMCGRCGLLPIEGRCGCADLHPSIRIARAVTVYDGWAGTSVRRVKYEGEPDRARHLASLMASCFQAFGHVDGIVPVPLHPSKLRSRGFNQSALIAKHLSVETGVPVMDVLKRTVDTVSQTTLSGRERKENVANAFSPDPAWWPHSGRRYVIVDDVFTTGATLGACADVLATVASPDMIGALTFVKDMQRDDLMSFRQHVQRIRTAGNPTL